MPLYEYRCQACRQEFEQLIRGTDVPLCPSCGGRDVTRLVSAFAVSSEQIRKTNLASGKKGQAKGHRDQAIADREAWLHHDD